MPRGDAVEKMQRLLMDELHTPATPLVFPSDSELRGEPKRFLGVVGLLAILAIVAAGLMPLRAALRGNGGEASAAPRPTAASVGSPSANEKPPPHTAVPDSVRYVRASVNAPVNIVGPEGFSDYAWRVNGTPCGAGHAFHQFLRVPGTYRIECQASNSSGGAAPTKTHRFEWEVLVEQ